MPLPKDDWKRIEVKLALLMPKLVEDFPRLQPWSRVADSIVRSHSPMVQAQAEANLRNFVGRRGVRRLEEEFPADQKEIFENALPPPSSHFGHGGLTDLRPSFQTALGRFCGPKT